MIVTSTVASVLPTEHSHRVSVAPLRSASSRAACSGSLPRGVLHRKLLGHEQSDLRNQQQRNGDERKDGGELNRNGAARIT